MAVTQRSGDIAAELSPEHLIAAKRGEIISTAERVVSAVREALSSRFNEKDVIFLFDGSTSGKTPYASVLGVSDIDITVFIPNRKDNGDVLNMKKFSKITDAIREAIENLEKTDGIYVVTSHNFPEESILEDLARFHIARKTGMDDKNIKLALLDCVIYPSLDAVESWANLRNDGLRFAAGLALHGKLMYGDPDVKEELVGNLLSSHKANNNAKALSELEKALVTSEKHLADAHVNLRTNLNLPYDTLAKYVMKRLKVIGNSIGNALIQGSYDGDGVHNGSWHTVMENKHKLPDLFRDFVVEVNDTRESILQTGKLPEMDQLIRLCDKASHAIMELNSQKQ